MFILKNRDETARALYMSGRLETVVKTMMTAVVMDTCLIGMRFRLGLLIIVV